MNPLSAGFIFWGLIILSQLPAAIDWLSDKLSKDDDGEREDAPQTDPDAPQIYEPIADDEGGDPNSDVAEDGDGDGEPPDTDVATDIDEEDTADPDGAVDFYVYLEPGTYPIPNGEISVNEDGSFTASSTTEGGRWPDTMSLQGRLNEDGSLTGTYQTSGESDGFVDTPAGLVTYLAQQQGTFESQIVLELYPEVDIETTLNESSNDDFVDLLPMYNAVQAALTDFLPLAVRVQFADGPGPDTPVLPPLT